MKQNKGLITELRQSLFNKLNEFKSHPRLLPENLIVHQKGLIYWISELEWQACEELKHMSLDAWEFLSTAYPETRNSDIDRDVCLNWVELVDWARKGQLEQQVSDENAGCVVNIMMGYVLIFDLAQHVIEFYANLHPTEKAVLYVRHGKLLEDHLFFDELEHAYRTLLPFKVFKKSKHNWKSLGEHEKVQLELLYEALHLEIDEALSNDSIDDQIERVVNGDENLRFIPRKTKYRRIDESRKKSNRPDQYRSKPHFSLEQTINDESGITFKDQLDSGDDVEHLTKTLDDEKLIEYLTKQISLILTDRELQVISMRYLQNSGDICSLSAVGRELGITKQTVDQINKNALKKLSKALRRYTATFQ